MENKLPIDKQDYCPFCNAIRTETQGNNASPRCPRQGCPGQHTHTPGKPVNK